MSRIGGGKRPGAWTTLGIWCCVKHHTNFPLNSPIGYITPRDILAGWKLNLQSAIEKVAASISRVCIRYAVTADLFRGGKSKWILHTSGPPHVGLHDPQVTIPGPDAPGTVAWRESKPRQW